MSLLFSHLTKGTKIVGLKKLIMGSATSTDGGYRVSKSFFGSKTVTFFEQCVNGYTPVSILPYVEGKISSTPMGGNDVISGEFTGCLMTIYNDDQGARWCGHVCTAENKSMRGDWQQGKANGEYTNVVELDTSRKNKPIGSMVVPEIPMMLGASILCVATPGDPGDIRFVYVQAIDNVYTVLKVGKLEKLTG